MAGNLCHRQTVLVEHDRPIEAVLDEDVQHISLPDRQERQDTPPIRLLFTCLDGIFNEIRKDHGQIRTKRRTTLRNIRLSRYSNPFLRSPIEIRRQRRIDDSILAILLPLRLVQFEANLLNQLQRSSIVLPGHKRRQPLQILPPLIIKPLHQRLRLLQRLDVILIRLNLRSQGVIALVRQIHGIDLLQAGPDAQGDEHCRTGNDEPRHKHFKMNHIRHPLGDEKQGLCKEQTRQDTDIFPIPPRAQHMVVAEYVIEIADQKGQTQRITKGIQAHP